VVEEFSVTQPLGVSTSWVFFLQCPAPFDGLCNASPAFGGEVSLPRRVPGAAFEHGTGLFQLADLTVNLGQNIV